MGTTTSAFAQALAKKRPKGARCSITVLLGNLDDDTRDEVAAALDDPDIGHTQITDALAAIGHEVGTSSVGRHRNHQCKCEQ